MTQGINTALRDNANNMYTVTPTQELPEYIWRDISAFDFLTPF